MSQDIFFTLPQHVFIEQIHKITYKLNISFHELWHCQADQVNTFLVVQSSNEPNLQVSEIVNTRKSEH